MLDWLAQRRRRKRTAQNLYGSIVALSRRPQLYAVIGVPDTVEGRFEMLVIHMFLVLDRLQREGEHCKPLAQKLVDEFFSDLDTTIRELGVGDFTVPKKMRRLAEVFDQRLHAYRAAIEGAPSNDLLKLLADNLELKNSGKRSPAARLADYMRQSVKGMDRQSVGELLNGLASGEALAPIENGVHAPS